MVGLADIPGWTCSSLARQTRRRRSLRSVTRWRRPRMLRSLCSSLVIQPSAIKPVVSALKFHANGDKTHTNLPGADKLASLVAGAIKTQNLALAQYLR